MAGKDLKCKKDEKQDLQKQIGCITGFFQLFDRHRLITNQRTSSSYIQNTPSSGVSNNKTKDLSKMQKTKAKNQEITKEKQQFSKESSITSVPSSSCSSSMSSLEFNRIVKTESSSTKQIQIPKNSHSKVTMNQHDTKNHQSLDFYDIVKDSMHREAKGLLHVKTFAKQEKKGHIDSPRPMLAHKSFNAGVMVSNEPINSLLKSKRVPWDSPRLSYDGRYVQDTLKSNTKHKELLPRFSLDSKQGSVRVINEGNKARNVLNGSQKGYERNSTTILTKFQGKETSKTSSGVVAKLMGLEVIPDMTIQTFVTSSRPTEQKEPMGRSRTSGEYKKHQSSDIITTNVKPYLRFALESTASSSYWLQDSKGSDSDIKASKSSLSVYGEIEKRLTELEFKKSGKDLRALKQILEAMQRYTDSSSSDSRNNNTTSLIESSKVQSSRTQQKVSETVAVETSNSIRSSKLPIVVMKPTKVTKKANVPPSTELSIHDKSCLSKCSSTNGRLVEKQKTKTFGLTTKNSKHPFGQSAEKNSYLRTSKLMQSSKSSHECNGKNSINSGNVTVTGSPRLQKKFGFERRSTPTSTSSDSIINRRQHNMQLVEFSSSNSTPRQNFSILQDRDESFKHHVNVISSDYDRNRSLATRSDIKVVCINQNNTFEEMRKERSKADKIVTAEQPSPVSVLDAAFYKEDPPSPVKNISNISKKLGESLSTGDDGEENSNANLSHGFDEKDTNTDNVARILQEIECFDEKLINFNNIKNPDHKYISEILLTSGLFNYHSSIKLLHSQGHLINPKLFLALEQMKTNKAHFNIEDDAKKMQRKLIFDVVNEILVKKLILENSTSFWYLPKLKGKMLLEEICEEIDELQRENRDASFVHEDENLISLLCSDLKNQNTVWTDCCGHKPNIGLDIEMSIFKDLITEIVRDELAIHFGDHCRKMLFSK